MASIAQAVTTSIHVGPTQTGAEQAALAPATAALTDGAGTRAPDTVNLTETGGRNVSIASQSGRPQPAFQVAYFPPSSAPGAKPTSATPLSIAAQSATAVPAQTNNPTAQVANAAAQAAAISSNSTGAANGSTSPSQASLLSAASQAKLQQLDQVLQQLGINPAQVSFAERIALLPLVNDPAAIQQYIQGLPTQTAVLNPATSQVLAPSLVNQQNAPTATQVSAAAATGLGAPSGGSSKGIAATSADVPPTFNPSFTPTDGAAAQSADTTGQKVNISV
jgi:hypothetical protein